MRTSLTSECVQWIHGLETLNLPQNPTETKARVGPPDHCKVFMAPRPHSSGMVKRPRAEGMRQPRVHRGGSRRHPHDVLAHHVT